MLYSFPTPAFIYSATKPDQFKSFFIAISQLVKNYPKLIAWIDA